MTDTPEIQTFQRIEQLHQAAADSFCHAVHETLASRDRFRVSLSGGSTPKTLYQLLSKRDLPWDRIHWFWGDERNVDREHHDCNAKMVREALLDQVNVPKDNIHPVHVSVADPIATASAYEQLLRDHFPGDSYPKWDLALLGMGDDGHTASLFPNTEALDQTQRWFVANWVEQLDAYRYTLTAPAINSALRSWFLVAGSGKAAALKQVLSGAYQPRQYPSQLIQPTHWLVTEDAFDGVA